MKDETKIVIRDTKTFTREEILNTLGIDLKDYIHARINFSDNSITFTGGKAS